MRVAVLGSGSGGNSVLVCAGDTRLLVDAGFSARALCERLELLGIDPSSIDAIVITHDHRDHTRGIGVFARKHGTPVYMTEGTRRACEDLLRGVERVTRYGPGRPFSIGRLRIEPFVIVHDAADPAGVTVVDEHTGLRVGIATDLGRPTAQTRHALRECDLLVLEANHDEVLLHTGPYPSSVKRRIASSHGHLSNQAAARLATELMHPRLAGIVLAHLSVECNRPTIAERVVGEALKRAGWTGHIEVACQDIPTRMLDLEELRLRSGPVQLSLL
ncbi:MAG: MBL fold metallo-hydrolase [Gemmatimonadales bacterium]